MAARILPSESASVDDSLYECIDGHLVERGVGGEIHASSQFEITVLLRPFVKELGGQVLPEWTIANGADWLTPDVTFSYPDYKINEIGRLIAPAFLCVEVRSETQGLRELFDKWKVYQRWNVPYCWIIDPRERMCYECSADGSRIKDDFLEAGPIRVAVADIWAAVTSSI